MERRKTGELLKNVAGWSVSQFEFQAVPNDVQVFLDHSLADFEMFGQVTAQISAGTYRDHLYDFDDPADALSFFKAACCRHILPQMFFLAH